MKHHKTRSLAVASLFALGMLALAQGCGDDDNDKPDPVIPVDEGGSGGKGATGGKSNGGSAGKDNNGGGKDPVGDGGTGDGGTGNTGTGATGATGDGGDGPVEPPECTLPELGEDGCFNCPKDKEPVQWLNRCVAGSKCVEFDNGTRVPRLPADGKLPPFEP